MTKYGHVYIALNKERRTLAPGEPAHGHTAVVIWHLCDSGHSDVRLILVPTRGSTSILTTVQNTASGSRRPNGGGGEGVAVGLVWTERPPTIHGRLHGVVWTRGGTVHEDILQIHNTSRLSELVLGYEGVLALVLQTEILDLQSVPSV